MSLIRFARKWLYTPWLYTPTASLAPKPVPLLQDDWKLQPAHSIRFDDASGHALQCLAGSLWITHDHDPRDVIVEAGESYRVVSHQHMIVHALQESALRMR